MHPPFIAAAVLGAVASLATPVLAAEPPPQVMRMVAQTAKAASFHMDATTPAGSVAVDFVRPNDFDMTTSGTELLRVGEAYYTKPSPATGWIRVPQDQIAAIAGTVPQLTQAPEAYAHVPADAAFLDRGPETLDGHPMHKYAIVRGTNGPNTTLWIGDDDRLYRVDVKSPQGAAEVRFSKYDQIPKIAVPL